MKYTFRTFYCGSGDCIFLVLENGNCTLNIMVDCGKYTEEIDGFVRTELKNKIEPQYKKLSSENEQIKKLILLLCDYEPSDIFDEQITIISMDW